MFILRDGRSSLGAEPAYLTGYLINRNSVPSIIGEPFLCQMDNTAYTIDAGEGGFLGNAATPAGVITDCKVNLAPCGAAIRGQAAVGARVEVCFFGLCQLRVTSTGAVAQGTGSVQMLAGNLGSTHLTLVSGYANNTRIMGGNASAKAGAGVETILCLFDGLQNRVG